MGGIKESRVELVPNRRTAGEEGDEGNPIVPIRNQLSQKDVLQRGGSLSYTWDSSSEIGVENAAYVKGVVFAMGLLRSIRMMGGDQWGKFDRAVRGGGG